MFRFNWIIICAIATFMMANEVYANEWSGETNGKSKTKTIYFRFDKSDIVDTHDTIVQKCPVATTADKYTVAAVRSNLLAPLMNVGIEVPIGNRWSVGADYYYPWIPRKADHKDCFQLLGVNLEGRYWFGAARSVAERLKGHSMGVTLGGGYFDFERNYKGDQGEYILIGADYQFAMPIFKNKLHLEFSIGLGYIYSSMRPYEVFEPGGTAFKEGYTKKNHWIGPTKAAISLVIPIKKKNRQ